MKILVVEDSLDMQELLRVCLENAGFNVTLVGDGEVVLEEVARGNYEAVVLDILLPNRGGLDIISALRALKKDIPILAISAQHDLELRIKALDLGADDFLVKDFPFDELIARLKKIIRRSVGRSHNIFRALDITMDYSSRQVSVRNKVVSLTKKEWEILFHLIKNKNRAVSKNILTEKIWGKPDQTMNSNTMDVHIRSLRKKIGDESGEMIETIRGHGYIIREKTGE
jgi:two-component system, OmpR family, response regulator ArlR